MWNDSQVCQWLDAIILTANDFQLSYLHISFVKKVFSMYHRVCFKKNQPACSADNVSFCASIGKTQAIVKVLARLDNVCQLG